VVATRVPDIRHLLRSRLDADPLGADEMRRAAWLWVFSPAGEPATLGMRTTLRGHSSCPLRCSLAHTASPSVGQAARRPRLTPDLLDERERLVAIASLFLRFGRNATGARADCAGARADPTGATGDCSGATVAGCSAGGDGRAVARLRASRWLFTGPAPRGSLNNVPYQSMSASTACSHDCAASMEIFIGAVTL
jgi:hypothetical protein